jgi:hypothetical protein
MTEKPAATENDRPAGGAGVDANASRAGVGVDFDELESDVDQLLTRASAINHSLDTLKQEQARTGLGLRGDIAGRQEAMNLNLTRAREAVQQRNRHAPAAVQGAGGRRHRSAREVPRKIGAKGASGALGTPGAVRCASVPVRHLHPRTVPSTPRHRYRTQCTQRT